MGIMFLGGILALFIFILRIPVIRFCISRETTVSDASLMAMMTPKGLVSAVLAAIPLQRGVEGGETIQMLVYSIIFFSIIFMSLLIFFLKNSVFSDK